MQADNQKYKALRRQLTAIKRRKFTPDWRANRRLAEDLEHILDEIEMDLIPSDAFGAWNLLHLILSADEAFLLLTDDSSGLVGDAVRRVAPLWMKAALRIDKPETFWSETIDALAQGDEYGIRGYLLEHAAELVSEAAIEKLAESYRAQASSDLLRKAARKDGYSPKLSRITACLEKCAVALRRPALYEEAVRIRVAGDDLPVRLLFDIAERYAACGCYAEALERLGQPVGDRNLEEQRLELIERIHQERSDRKGLRSVREQLLEIDPSASRFSALAELLSPAERAALRERLVSGTSQDGDIYRSVKLLLSLGEVERALRLLVERQDRLQEFAYPRNTHLLKLMEGVDGMEVGKILCLRGLILDILDRSFSKGYRYAAGYLVKSRKLSAHVSTWPERVVDHEQFLDNLRAAHGRKRAFWARVEELG